MMNIESTNLVNTLPSTAAVDGFSSSLQIEGTTAEGFSEALKTQIQLLAEINNTNQAVTGATLVSTENQGDVQEFADLIGNGLPVSYKVGEEDDNEAALSVVKDSLKYLEADTGAMPTMEQLTQAASTQKIQQQANADSDQLQAKADADDKLEELQRAEEVRNQEGLSAQMMLMSGTESAASLPVSNSLNESNKQAEQLSLVKPFSDSGKAKPANELNQVKGDELQQKIVGEEAVAADVVISGQGGRTEKTVQNEQPFSTDADIDIHATGVAVNGQFDKTMNEVKSDVPALTRPLTHPEWNKDLGERIVWMNNRALPAAEINLNPQHLGPVSVRIDMNQDQASIVFTAQHAAVRDALEASVPKLREMLNEQQINLVNVSVAQNGGSEQQNSQSQSFNQANSEVGAEPVDAVGGTENNENERVSVSNGLLSMYV